MAAVLTSGSLQLQPHVRARRQLRARDERGRSASASTRQELDFVIGFDIEQDMGRGRIGVGAAA